MIELQSQMKIKRRSRMNDLSWESLAIYNNKRDSNRYDLCITHSNKLIVCFKDNKNENFETQN